MKSLALLVLIAGQVPLPSPDELAERALFERGQTNQIAYEQERFLYAGFLPLDTVRAEGRAVKRVLFHDPYGMIPVPGVEVERAADGVVTLKVIGPAGTGAPVKLPRSAWDRLTDLQGDLFKRKAYVPRPPRRLDDPVPWLPRPCHGWSALFGTADETGTGSGSWGECGASGLPELAFAFEMARLAVSTRPDCTFADFRPFWSFSECFAPASPS